MEVMIGSVVFVVIFTGLATFMQTSMLTSRTGTEVNSCILHYKTGIDILARGDFTSGHSGVMQASAAYICPVLTLVTPPETATPPITTWLEYHSNLATYQVWLNNGQLFRNRDGLDTKILMGENPPGAAEARSRIVATFSPSPPIWEVRPNSGAANALLVFPITVFQDINRDLLPNEEETSITFEPKFFLRNSE